MINNKVEATLNMYDLFIIENPCRGYPLFSDFNNMRPRQYRNTVLKYRAYVKVEDTLRLVCRLELISLGLLTVHSRSKRDFPECPLLYGQRRLANPYVALG